MGHFIDEILPHPGGGQIADPLNIHSLDGGKLDPLGLFKPPPATPEAQIIAQQEAQPLLDAAKAGTLTTGQQAQVTALQQGITAQGSQMMASAGLGRSSSEVAVLNQATQAATQLTADFINQDYQEGLNLLGVSNQGLVDAANLAIQQDEAMGQAFGQAASAFSQIYGYDITHPQSPPVPVT